MERFYEFDKILVDHDVWGVLVGWSASPADVKEMSEDIPDFKCELASLSKECSALIGGLKTVNSASKY